MATDLRYVVITPARNEAQFIELTLKSMVSQSLRPIRWVIVSDGSTDATDQIVSRYLTGHPWIQLVRMPERRERHFAGKVHAFKAGYEQVKELDYDVICSLDADISFDENYFSFLLAKLAGNPNLGLVGTPFRENTSKEVYDYRFVSIEHVSGACQVFRRECFEEIGGYSAVTGGGIDYIAVVTARMKGWKTRTFTETASLHHRQMGSAQNGVLAARFKLGVKDYSLGNHPAWELFRSAYQMTKRPLVLGGFALGCGYLWAALRRIERAVSAEFVEFCGQEQMRRLKGVLTRRGASAMMPVVPGRPARRGAR
jgi:glycosyltransferase involved in cell wall biosynthesis